MPLGDFGHIAIIVAFVASLVAITCYYASLQAEADEATPWERMARYAFCMHFLMVTAAMVILFTIIYGHHFEYYYAWKHSSRELPYYYIISCFWEGQEGSFLVWIFWNALLGWFIVKTARIREAGVMIVIVCVQAFLLSMILGVYVGDLKIGSSAFSYLKDIISDPIYKIDPTYVPEDGNGLNPLLQNIWMVIHPPIIFLGFGLTLMPFAYAVAGLAQRDYTGWLPKAQVWTGLSVAVLGLGIMMGAYWAYETLNFGGYWNWDPVENAILIPWLVLLAALHGMMIYSRKEQGLLFTTGLIIASFVLVVYSTFLTRSGILGDSSVHSFTDLGLSGQLLMFLLTVVLVSVFLIYKRKKEYHAAHSKSSMVSLWLVIGVSVICLSAFQVLLPTSIPVFSAMLSSVGLELNLAPPADPVMFYNQYQLWFAVGFGLAMGTAQLFYWNRNQDEKSIEALLTYPATITLVVSAAVILLARVSDWQFMVLVISTLYGLSACFYIMYHTISVARWELGGTLAHIGFSLMILGFVFSGGYAKVISRNLTINSPESSLPIHTIQENTLLNRNQTKTLGDYQMTFEAVMLETADFKHKIDRDFLLDTNYPEYKLLSKSFEHSGKTYEAGDTVRVNLENTYYKIAIERDGQVTTIMPRMQNNPTMGYIASPDVRSFWNKDVYVHISNFPDPKKKIWSSTEALQWNPGDTIEYKGILMVYHKTSQAGDEIGISEPNDSFTLQSSFTVLDQQNQYNLTPLYQIRADRPRLYPDRIDALGIEMVVDRIDPMTGSVSGLVRTSQRDWITVKAKEMPFIGLVWLGTVVMVLGVMVAVVRRIAVATASDDFVPMTVVATKAELAWKHPKATNWMMNRLKIEKVENKTFT